MDPVRNLSHIRILGSTVHLVSIDEVVFLMDRWIQQGQPRCRQIVVTGFHGLWEAHKNADLKRIFNSADLWIPDGIAPILIARLRGNRIAKRVPGAEVMQLFLELANEKGYSSFFYGDTDNTLAKLVEKLRDTYPTHRVVGTLSPPFRPLTPQENKKIIDTINNTKPDVLWVGLGTPKQDRWIFEHKHQLKVPIAIGVGAAFKFLSGKVRRAPNWIGDHGLEWLWRLILEPKKLWRRDLLDGPRFVGHVLLELSGLRTYD